MPATATRKSSKKNDIAKIMTIWRSSMEAFVEDAILYDTGKKMSPQQRAGCRELTQLIRDKEEGKRRNIRGLSVQSGKGTGKDAFSAWVIIWLLFCYPNTKIPCVSVSAHQLKTVLWGELRKWLAGAIQPVKDAIEIDSETAYRADIGGSVKKDPNWMAFGKAANPRESGDGEDQVVGLQGLHADYMVQIADEVSGIKDNVMSTLEKNMTGPVNLMLLIFNPTRTTGYAVETHINPIEKKRWVTLRWNAEESPLVSRETIEEIEEKYGRDSNPYRVNVLGLPPLVDTDTLIPYDWIMDAVERPVEPLKESPLVMGFDVGGGGDKSVLCWRKGPKVFPLEKTKAADSVTLKNWAGSFIDEVKPDVVRVDNVGIGWAVHGELRDQKGAIIEKADARAKSTNPERWDNMRMEMYWHLREAFEDGAISIPNDQELIDQLAAQKTQDNHKKLVEKKRLKKEIGTSPDESDALAFTYFKPDELVSRYRARKGRRPRPRARGAHAWLNH